MCGATGPKSSTRAEAIGRWNRRRAKERKLGGDICEACSSAGPELTLDVSHMYEDMCPHYKREVAKDITANAIVHGHDD